MNSYEWYTYGTTRLETDGQFLRFSDIDGCAAVIVSIDVASGHIAILAANARPRFNEYVGFY